MIRIKSQDAIHQYDETGRAITTWDGGKCAWIVEKQFENEPIDWYGKDSDFPGGMTMKEYEEMYPDWNNNPNITVSWIFKTRDALVRCFRSEYEFKEWYDKQTYPYIYTKHWGYFSRRDVPNLQAAIKQFETFGEYRLYADEMHIQYNNEKASFIRNKSGVLVNKTEHEETI